MSHVITSCQATLLWWRDGMTVLSPGGMERTRWLVWERGCIMTKRYLRMGFGYMHNEPQSLPMGANMAAYGHTGTGGAFA